ncbi:copper chaperone PCu(A)C [Brevundimonas balnearis]|uniref:Copper chaperone PCu(A)C n=1 Tax=Brevundimonas balnearis TaxID=1572858 RepID=A0ABV6QZT0_9CAUL
MRTLLLSASAAMLLSACGQVGPEGSAPTTVEVIDAVCRPVPAGRDVTACYLTLTARGDDRLVAVSSPIAADAQIHEMTTEDGMMRMGEMADGLPLPAGRSVELRPGGSHLMLFGVAGPLQTGDDVPLTLTFEGAEPLEVIARAGEPAAAGGAAH